MWFPVVDQGLQAMASTELTVHSGRDASQRQRRLGVAHAAIERDPNLVAAVTEAATVRDARARVRSSAAVPDRMAGLVTGGSFLAILGVWLAQSPPSGVPWFSFGALMVAYVAAASIEFEIGPGCALPTAPVLYLSLFLLPPQLVPVVALVGLVGSAWLSRLRDPSRHERLLVLAGSAWHSMGPALVFFGLGVNQPGPAALAACVPALGVQFACDAAATCVRGHGLGLAPGDVADALKFAFLVDALLAPLGVAAAFAVPGSPLALLVLVGPIGLLAVLRADRQRQIDRAVVLSEAFTQSADRARRDALTGLPNRLAWEEAVALHGARQSPVGLVLADVDGLKATNDALGHDAGDRLLIAVSRVVAEATPGESSAIAARLGGDEFGILLPGVLASRANRVAGNLKRLLSVADAAGGGPRISASVGYGVAWSGAELSRAFVAADRGLYEDKAARSIARR